MNGDPDLPLADHWIIVPKWERFQHYRNRNPLWIKVYAKLLHDPAFLGLSAASRGLLMVIWLLYSAESGSFPIRNLAPFGSKGVGYWQLKALSDAGFIELSASKPLAAKTEVEKEKESPSPLTDEDAQRQLQIRALDLTADWTGGGSDKFAEALEGLEVGLHARLGHLDRELLWDEVLRRERAERGRINP